MQVKEDVNDQLITSTLVTSHLQQSKEERRVSGERVYLFARRIVRAVGADLKIQERNHSIKFCWIHAESASTIMGIVSDIFY